MKGRSLAQESISQKGLLGKKFGCCFCGLQVLTENYITSFGLYKSTLKKTALKFKKLRHVIAGSGILKEVHKIA